MRTFNWNSFLPVVIDFFFNSNKDEGRNVWFLSCRIYIPFRKFCETTVELNSDKYAVKLNKSVKSWYQMSLSISKLSQYHRYWNHQSQCLLHGVIWYNMHTAAQQMKTRVLLRTCIDSSNIWYRVFLVRCIHEAKTGWNS